jgi:hypothetical protein
MRSGQRWRRPSRLWLPVMRVSGGGGLEHPSGTGEGRGKWKLTGKGSPQQHGPTGGRWEGGGDQHRAASTMVKETGVESVAPVGEDLEFWDESEMTRKAGYYL